MEVVERIIEGNHTLELGDIIKYNDEYYLVVREGYNTYIARNLNGDTGLFGVHETLERFNQEFVERGLPNRTTIFKKDEYRLVLEKI